MDNWIGVEKKEVLVNQKYLQTTNQLVQTENVINNNFESQKKNILSGVLKKRLMMLIYMLMKKVLMKKHNQSVC